MSASGLRTHMRAGTQHTRNAPTQHTRTHTEIEISKCLLHATSVILHINSESHGASDQPCRCLGWVGRCRFPVAVLTSNPRLSLLLQINMYLLSRLLFALCRLGVEKGYVPKLRWDPFPLHTAVIWGLVLWLFEYHRSTLQPSLQSSMTYLYEDSNIWHDISDFLIFNKSSPSK